MLETQSNIFISDLHLDEKDAKSSAEFLSLLTKCQEKEVTLYILGDFFEAWIGDDDYTSFHQSIISSLRLATERGVKIYFIHGNRDFLIGEEFAKQSGCELLPEMKKISIYGTSCLIMHGDTLCTRDIHYMRTRKWFRNSIIQALFLSLPLNWRRAIAVKLRNKSKAYTSNTVNELMDVTQHEVDRVMRENDVYILIHGHTHQPAVHSFQLDGKKAERIVLSAWHDKPKILVWDRVERKLISIDEINV